MAKLYEASESETGCPGEKKCPTWRSSAEDSEVRCPACPKMLEPGVGDQVSAEEEADTRPPIADTDDIVDVIERLVQERDAGFGFPDDLTQLEKELVMVWRDTVAVFERAHQRQTTMLLEALMRVSR